MAGGAPARRNRRDNPLPTPVADGDDQEESPDSESDSSDGSSESKEPCNDKPISTPLPKSAKAQRTPFRSTLVVSKAIPARQVGSSRKRQSRQSPKVQAKNRDPEAEVEFCA